MSGLLALLLIFAASSGLVAAYLLSGLDDWQPRERRRDRDSLRRLPWVDASYRERRR